MSLNLPHYRKPPVIEVSISVAFEPLEKARSTLMGILWSEKFSRYPQVEERSPHQPVIETFGPASQEGQPTLEVEMLDRPPPVRLWFVNDEGTEVVQVQRDWFARNWRKVTGSEEYPRYDSLIGPFQEDFEAFADFFERRGIGPIVPIQCELTYVNHITGQGVWSTHAELDKVLEPVAFTDSRFLPQPESSRYATRYVISDDEGDPVGRLHVAIEPGYRRDTKEPIFNMTLSARGIPEGDGADGAYRFLDRGHLWIVKAFETLTSDPMQRQWEKSIK